MNVNRGPDLDAYKLEAEGIPGYGQPWFNPDTRCPACNGRVVCSPFTVGEAYQGWCDDCGDSICSSCAGFYEEDERPIYRCKACEGERKAEASA